MTVCIAAICGNGSVFGATDRMITAGAVKFEIGGLETGPHSVAAAGSKMIRLTRSIYALTAGSADLQVELIQEVLAAINARDEADATAKKDVPTWWMVREIAEAFQAAYSRARNARARQKVLVPLGLDMKTFIDNQPSMDSALVKQIASELMNFEMPAVETIFAGIDTTGPHIYTFDNVYGTEQLSCRDSVGFIAVGSGGTHADNQFMLAGYNSKTATVSETLFLTYLAKKRAEVAPGVGEGTDMFTTGPAIGTAAPIYSRVVKKLEKIYKSHAKRESQSLKSSQKAAQDYVEEITKASAGSSATDAGQSASPDGEGV